jgi:DNA (cytosine-5)-methyltransferase 1
MPMRLLDLFCGAGGAAAGYQRAGFDVVGVDIAPQPRYPFEFHQADAMTFPLDGFDAIHASPPCQAYSRLRHLPWLAGRSWPALLAPTIERLAGAGLPWIVENVQDAPMAWSVVLCGQAMGLPFYRHRRFTSNVMLMAPPHWAHTRVIAPGSASLAARMAGSDGVTGVLPGERAGFALGIDWMTRAELTQAIPPAYTEHIGRQLIAQL